MMRSVRPLHAVSWMTWRSSLLRRFQPGVYCCAGNAGARKAAFGGCGNASIVRTVRTDVNEIVRRLAGQELPVLPAFMEGRRR
jgi:hypothetical protein